MGSGEGTWVGKSDGAGLGIQVGVKVGKYDDGGGDWLALGLAEGSKVGSEEGSGVGDTEG